MTNTSASASKVGCALSLTAVYRWISVIRACVSPLTVM